MFKYLLFIVISFSSFSAILGDVSETNIYPGHISFDKEDPFFKGYSRSVKNISGISKLTPSQLINEYFNEKNLDPNKIQKLIIDTQNYLKNVQKNVCINKFRKSINSYNECSDKFYKTKAFQKKWKSNKYNLALNFVIKNLSEVKSKAVTITKENINSKESLISVQKFFSAIELIEAIRGEDYQRAKLSSLLRPITQIQNILSRDYLSKNSKHSSNLLKNDINNMFYSYRELEELKKNSFDISKLEPASSGIWRKPKASISKYDTTSYNKDGIQQLQKVFKESFITNFLDPDEEINIEYRGSKLGGGQTIKFDGYIKDVKFKVKFITNKHQAKNSFSEGSLLKKHIQGSEANVEPVANTLAASIGYTVDPTYFKKKIRLYFQEDKISFETQRKNLINSLESRYTLASNPSSALSDVRVDKNGRKYLLVRSVSLEKKSNIQTDMNIGFFKRSGLGKSLKREHRAFYTFMALIMDIDLKDDNTKVKLVPYTTKKNKTSYKVMLSNSDMGSSLGTGHPNLYNFNLVKSHTDKRVDLNFIRIFSYDNRFTANLDDAKWITRRIAQLSLTQIENAFRYAGHTKLIAKYYALLFSKKRNQLVKALGLLGESFLDDSNKLYTIELLDEFTGSIEKFEQYFKNGFLTDPKNELQDDELESFPRFWGMSYNNFTTEDPQKKLIQDLKLMLKLRAKRTINENIISQASLSNAGIGFLNNGIFQNNVFSFCKDKCFFSAINIGVNSFIPFRFIIDNPNKKSKKPFLTVDIFRFGVYLGNSTSSFEENLDISQRDLLSINSGAKVFRLKEYIKVKEVDSLDDFFKNRPQIKLNTKEVFKSIENKVLELKNNESFLLREYLGIAGEIVARPTSYIPFSSIRLRSRAIGIKSNLVTKKNENILLRHGKIKSFDFDLTFNVIDMILRYPILRFANTTNKFSERVIKFSKNVKNKTVLNCLKSYKNCMAQISQKRETKISTTQSIIDFFKIFGYNRTKVKGFSHFVDFLTKNVVKEKYYIFKTNTFSLRKLVLTQGEIQSVAHINKKNEINIVVNLNYFRPAAKRHHLQLFLDDYSNLLPDDIANYDTSKMKLYLGDLSAKLDFVITNDGLNTLFADDFLKIRFCNEFAAFHKIEFQKSCLKSSNSLVRKFLRKYRLAQKAYTILKNTNIDSIRYRQLKIIAKFFYDKKFKANILKFVTRILKKKNFKRDLVITSSLNAFATDSNELKESNYFKGKAKDFEIINSNLLGSELMQVLNPFVYNNIDFTEL